ncbi:Lrp/AsnC ligand binding domain-containing protein [Kiloniella laminariae]|uniref:Lrp/AsnC ligand binding domain-containing protein n=1 Tax=Kiloniella laminariae TaxID=454162 RepID=A0ABT4LE62_9PROT|nr:Lrp/AsnC ligand binding domain-containing protein [Kiloniella laminariae]MCZ4279381.1 Lrp/AsnC ligand binding domain-containing protein [Kiloniella laminariae]
MTERTLDRIDRNILRVLQEDGRISNVELARRVNLSPTPCLERVRRLEQSNYIKGYMATLNPAKINVNLLVFVQITLEKTTSAFFEEFKTTIMQIPEVLECHMVSGGFDYLIKVRAADMTEYRGILGDKLAAAPGVSQTHSYVVMEEVKNTNILHVKDNF